MTTDGAPPAIDPAVLETLRQLNEVGQPDVVEEVLGLFTHEAPKRLDAIAAAISGGDARALQRAAHTLKGAAGTIGAAALSTLCRGLEEMGRQQTLDEAAATLAAVRVEFYRVRAEIDQLL